MREIFRMPGEIEARIFQDMLADRAGDDSSDLPLSRQAVARSIDAIIEGA